MTDKRFDRDDNRDGDRDDNRERRKRFAQIPTKYVFSVHGQPKPPEVYADRFRLGDIVSTSEGSHKVVEVFWMTATKAHVLLRRVDSEELKKLARKPEKPAQKPKKFSTDTSQKPARYQNQRKR